jgi:hypothetical protein
LAEKSELILREAENGVHVLIFQPSIEPQSANDPEGPPRLQAHLSNNVRQGWAIGVDEAQPIGIGPSVEGATVGKKERALQVIDARKDGVYWLEGSSLYFHWLPSDGAWMA